MRPTLWRVVCGRERGLADAPHKSGLLTAPRWRAVLDTLVGPLRGDNPDAWPLMDSMTVLGVSFSDPSDDAHVQATVVASLATAVVEPIRRLTRERSTRGRARAPPFSSCIGTSYRCLRTTKARGDSWRWQRSGARLTKHWTSFAWRSVLP